MLAVGLFGKDDRIERYTQGRSGLFHGGGGYLLGIQALTCLCVILWSTILTFLMLYVSVKLEHNIIILRSVSVYYSNVHVLKHTIGGSCGVFQYLITSINKFLIIT